MKLIKAKQSGKDRPVYINVDNICLFYSDQYDGAYKTKIYFNEGRCEIEGNHAEAIEKFITEYPSGLYDLTED